MRQYPLLNFTMAKSACAGAVAVRPSTSTLIAKRNFFIAHSPLCDPFCRRSLARGQKDFGNRIREPVTAQMDRWVNVTKLKNRLLQIWRLEKRRGKAASIWPCRCVTMFPLHSYPLSPVRGAFFFRTVRRTTHESNIRLPACALRRNQKAANPAKDKGPARFHDRQRRSLFLPSKSQGASLPRHSQRLGSLDKRSFAA
jgi:hypothetical protein